MTNPKTLTQYQVAPPVFDAYDREGAIKDALGSRRVLQRFESASIKSTNYKKGISGWKITPEAIEAAIFGVVAPASIPTHIGAMYIDTAADKIYIASGLLSTDWRILN